MNFDSWVDSSQRTVIKLRPLKLFIMQPNLNYNLIEGDIVFLKSSPDFYMTISSIDAVTLKAEVYWISDGLIHQQILPLNVLVPKDVQLFIP